MSETRLILGDCLGELKALPDSSVDAICTDPPYGINFMGKAWDGAAIAEAAETKRRETTQHLRLTGSPDSPSRTLIPRSGSAFQNRAGEAGAYDFSVRGNRAFQQWCETWGAECLRVLKPGGHMLVFGGTRTYHRLACGLEDAGFEIRDEILAWMFGSGFPKSHNLADDWDGWGTALKPAHEPIVVARKPLIGTVAANVLANGTGALNIDGCRIATGDSLGGGAELDVQSDKPDGWDRPWRNDPEAQAAHAARVRDNVARAEHLGRWPANVILVHAEDCVQVGVTQVDSNGHFPSARPGGVEITTVGHAGQVDLDERHMRGETVETWECVEGCPVRMLDEQSGITRSFGGANGGKLGARVYGAFANETLGANAGGLGDVGGASRFFYCAKVSRAERNAGLDGFTEKMPHDNAGHVHADGRAWDVPGSHSTPRANHHPTVKPIALMRWLIRLVTPPDGVVLDPFLGSGSTGCAAALEGFRFIGVEREDDYMEIAAARIAFWAEHGEDGLRICAERDGLVAKRAAVEAAGQLSFLDC